MSNNGDISEHEQSMKADQLHDTIRQLVDCGSVTVTVRGECMTPLINNNSRLRVTPARLYWPGDVVVALTADNRYQVHRVIGVYRHSGTFRILTQADNGAGPDPAVPAAALLGKVAGGSCHPHAVKIPICHRLRAMTRFLRLLASRFCEKFCLLR